MCLLAVIMKRAKVQQTHVHELRLLRQIPRFFFFNFRAQALYNQVQW